MKNYTVPLKPNTPQQSEKTKLSGKKFYFLRNYNHPKRGKLPPRGRRGTKNPEEKINGKVVRGLLNSIENLFTHTSKMIRNNKKGDWPQPYLPTSLRVGGKNQEKEEDLSEEGPI